MASSSQRSQRELIDLLNVNIDMPPHELQQLPNADSSTLTQQEHDKLMNTVVHVDLDHMADHINRAKARGDNTVVLNVLPHPRAKPKARSNKCSGPATKR